MAASHCRYQGCRKNRIKKENRQSNFCVDHTCEARGCFFIVLTEKLCSHHQRCGYPKCNHTTIVQPDGRKWFCTSHRCKQEKCRNERESGRRLCRHHLKCAAPSPFSCKLPPVPGSEYCAGHTCESTSCTNFVIQGRCEKHKFCEKPGCRRYRKPKQTGGGFERFCQKHITCRSNQCQNLVVGSSRFCDKHFCHFSGCKRERCQDGAQFYYCTEHTCRFDTCVTSVFPPTSHHTPFCSHHKCKEVNCADGIGHGTTYCTLHKCTVTRCDRKRVGRGSAYCKRHECKNSDCFAEAVPPGGYCLSNRHGCIEDGCTQPRLDGEERCSDHLVAYKLMNAKRHMIVWRD